MTAHVGDAETTKTLELHTAHETLQTCQFSVSISDCEYLTYLITLLHARSLSQSVWIIPRSPLWQFDGERGLLWHAPATSDSNPNPATSRLLRERFQEQS